MSINIQSLISKHEKLSFEIAEMEHNGNYLDVELCNATYLPSVFILCCINYVRRRNKDLLLLLLLL
jgi:hypothetical protein